MMIRTALASRNKLIIVENFGEERKDGSEVEGRPGTCRVRRLPPGETELSRPAEAGCSPGPLYFFRGSSVATVSATPSASGREV